MEKIYVNNCLLDDEQTRIAISLDKHSIVVAGAGSGKTFTILGKIQYLLSHHLYKPEEFCCISFTKESSVSLKNKIRDVCHENIDVFTFHRLALNVLSNSNIKYSICKNDLLKYIIDEFFASQCFGNRFLAKIVFRYFGYILPSKKNWKRILNSKKLVRFKNLIITFISLFKNTINNDFPLLLRQYHKKYSILFLFYAIYLCFETEKQSTFSLDFDDMIVEATRFLKNHRLSLPYKYIIIDEFQDTSEVRFSFIQEILKQTNASLCVVGDDFQSIYHFSGCDLFLFLNFQNYFSDCKMFKIQNTYRNSQELIDLAGSFVQKNPYQIFKTLHSIKSLPRPVKIVYFRNSFRILPKLLKKIRENKSIFILARNSFNIHHYLQSYRLEDNQRIVLRNFEKYDIRYLTIHKSKGLECDVVIVLDVENGFYGIPSLLKDQDVISLVKKSDNYLFEEERRLFYVALTRAKEEVYLLVPQKNPSCFISEIKKSNNVEEISFF